MINPQGFDASAVWNDYVQNRTQARRYWRESLLSARSWRNALTGRVDYRRLGTVLLRQATEKASGAPPVAVASVATRVSADLAGLARRGVRTLLVCSEGDDGIEYMNVILGRDVRRRALSQLDVAILPGADHSLTLLDSQKRVVRTVAEWAAALHRPAPSDAAASEQALAVAAVGPSRVSLSQ
jgi:hypothetical protein